MDKDQQDPRWGSEGRDRKAEAILVTLRHVLPESVLSRAVAVDIGCGSGEIAFHLAAHLGLMTGVDPEPWTRWDTFRAQRPNLRYLSESGERLPLPDNSVDLVVCNQVYEHVPHPRQLISEIHRIMKPGGHCYFAGPNLLFPIEPHVFWPFVHWLPRGFAVKLMRLCGSKGILDAYSTDYWRLRQWLGAFHIRNCVPYILRHPREYNRTGGVWRILGFLPEWLVERTTWISPGFVFVLRKPD